MARVARLSRAETRRADPEVVEKRRAARLFNDLLMNRRAGAGDGRTERRRRRMLEELATGKARGRRELTPVDVLSRVTALLELGETVESIEQARPLPAPAAMTPELVDGLRRIHDAYGFPAAAYAFVGVSGPLLRRAGILADPRRKGAGPAERSAPGLASARTRAERADASARRARRPKVA